MHFRVHLGSRDPAPSTIHMRYWVFGLILICAAISAREGFRYSREWLNVDSCLDSGGSFDYSRMVCDYKENHAFVSYSQRHPNSLLIGGSALSIGLCAAFAAQQIRRRMEI
jgi:hypothetical protein